MAWSREIAMRLRGRTATTDRATAAAPVYRVGEAFLAGRTRWEAEARFSVEQGGYALTLFLPGVTPEAERAVREEVTELALIYERPLMVLAYRFGQGIPWGDLPYAWPLAEGRGGAAPPSADDDASPLLWITLVDAHDGLIRAQRGLPMDGTFARAVGEAIRDQARQPFDGHAYLQAIGDQYLGRRDPLDRLGSAIARMRSAG
jgi:hypothetical protein